MLAQIQQLTSGQPDPMQQASQLLGMQHSMESNQRAAEMQSHQINEVYPQTLRRQESQDERGDFRDAMAMTQLMNGMQNQKFMQGITQQRFAESKENSNELNAYRKANMDNQNITKMMGMMDFFERRGDAGSADLLMQQISQNMDVQLPNHNATRQEIAELQAVMASPQASGAVAQEIERLRRTLPMQFQQ